MPADALAKTGGADRDRTDDLVIANDALFQLSYSPIRGKEGEEREKAGQGK
jgi:hypothetical protein